MYTNSAKFFFSKRLFVSEKIEKIRAHIRVRFGERAIIFTMCLYSEFLKIKDFNTQDNGLSVHVRIGLGK